jgi:hypothetical protein
MYPWYVSYQVIVDLAPKRNPDHPVYPTAFELLDGEGSSFTLYMGDSLGNLHIIKQYEIEGPDTQEKLMVGFEIDRTNFKHHRLNINCIKYIPKEHLVVSSGYDQCLYAFEALS